MARKAPGKAHRKGLTLLEIADMFRDEDESRKWIEQQRWQGSPHCPECGSLNVQCGVEGEAGRPCRAVPPLTQRWSAVHRYADNPRVAAASV